MLPEKSPLARRAALALAAASAIVLLPPAVGAMAAGPSLFGRAAPVGAPAGSHLPEGTALYAVDCTAGGSCAAGGNYEQKNGSVQAMVVTRSHGRWARATTLLMPRNASRQPYAEVEGIACTGRGTCVAVGNYGYGSAHHTGAFIVGESHGRWARAIMPRLPAGSAQARSAQLDAVSCNRSGFCEAVGSYRDTRGHDQAMALAGRMGGRWAQAVEIMPPQGAAANPAAIMTGLACTAAGSCVAVGNYSVSGNDFQAMGALEARGLWHRAVKISAPAHAVPSRFTALSSVSCTPRGSCLGVGTFAVSQARNWAMTVTESKGRFARAVPVPALPPGASAGSSTALASVSCPPRGRCAAVGVASNKAGQYVAASALRAGTRWSAAYLRQPADASTGKHQQSSLFAVDCPARDQCLAVGYYNDNSGGYRAEAAVSG